jgi:L-ascorbate metabolism protein UlaG (beta-lactamase superfamily)
MVVVTDPFPPSLGLRMDPRPAAVVTVSNTHPNHSAADAVAGDPRVFSAPGEYEYNGIVVRGVMTPLPAGLPRERRNVAYTIEMDGVNLCHLGRLSLPLTTRQVDELKPVDVVMAPAGGRAISLDQALQTIQDLDPRIVIPMHFAQGQAGLALEGPEAFLRRLGQDEAQPQPRLVVTTGNLPADLRVNLLTPPRS